MNTQGDYRDLLEKTSQFAKMGSWKIDLTDNKLYWCPVTREIFEVSADYQCNVEDTDRFYKDSTSKKAMSIAYQRAVKKNQEYDIKLK